MTLYKYAHEASGQVAEKADVEKAIANSALEGEKVGAAAERTRILSIAASARLENNVEAFKTAIALAGDAPEMAAEKIIEHALKSSKGAHAVEADANPAALANREDSGEFDAIGAFNSLGQMQASSCAFPDASDVFASRRKATAERAAKVNASPS